MVGAHLDSVDEGPGINDNGSGVSGILEIAEEIAEMGDRPRNRLRFAFWGAEESGLVGSTAYVEEQVENGTADQIEANLNFDMIGSPNFARFVYDGDLSDYGPFITDGIAAGGLSRARSSRRRKSRRPSTAVSRDFPMTRATTRPTTRSST